MYQISGIYIRSFLIWRFSDQLVVLNFLKKINNFLKVNKSYIYKCIKTPMYQFYFLIVKYDKTQVRYLEINIDIPNSINISDKTKYYSFNSYSCLRSKYIKHKN